MEVKTARNLGVVIGVVLLLATLGMMMTGTVHANGCNLGKQVDRILIGEINEDLVISDRVCIGEFKGALTVINGDITVKKGGVVKIGGRDRPAVVNGDLNVKSGGKLQVKDTINGDVIAFGNAKIDLPLQARVFGDVIHHGFETGCTSKCGSVSFKGGPNKEGKVEDPIHGQGALIDGDVLINGGAVLTAPGPNENNTIGGDLICDQFSKVVGGTSTNWDNTGTHVAAAHDEETGEVKDDHAVDGVVGGDYECGAPT